MRPSVLQCPSRSRNTAVAAQVAHGLDVFRPPPRSPRRKPSLRPRARSSAVSAVAGVGDAVFEFAISRAVRGADRLMRPSRRLRLGPLSRPGERLSEPVGTLRPRARIAQERATSPHIPGVERDRRDDDQRNHPKQRRHEAPAFSRPGRHGDVPRRLRSSNDCRGARRKQQIICPGLFERWISPSFTTPSIAHDTCGLPYLTPPSPG